jgi:hypothetical protein
MKIDKTDKIECHNDALYNFALRIATAMDDLKSSHVYFVVQKAFGEALDWSEAEGIFKTIMNQCDCKECKKVKNAIKKRFDR